MKKTKIAAFALGTALLSLLLFFGTAAVAPDEACAGNCEFGWSTVAEWGKASTCAQAQTNCRLEAEDLAVAQCAAINKGLCQYGTYTASACYWAEGQWVVDCFLDYKCDGGPEFPF